MQHNRAEILAAMARLEEEPVGVAFTLRLRERLALDELAVDLGITRAELLRRAVRDLLDAHHMEELRQ